MWSGAAAHGSLLERFRLCSRSRARQELFARIKHVSSSGDQQEILIRCADFEESLLSRVIQWKRKTSARSTN